MKLIDKPLIIKDEQYGIFRAYSEVEPELIPTGHYNERVLPAQFFYSPMSHFYTIIKKYEPGSGTSFPNGGYTVRGNNGEVRNYNLDEVVIHPKEIGHQPTLDMIALGDERYVDEDKRAARKQHQLDNPKIKGDGKRGRKPLSEEERIKRQAEKDTKALRSTGKRGRPKSDKPKIEKTSSGGKRGRPTLSPELKAIRDAELLAKSLKPKGKRGRPTKSK